MTQATDTNNEQAEPYKEGRGDDDDDDDDDRKRGKEKRSRRYHDL